MKRFLVLLLALSVCVGVVACKNKKEEEVVVEEPPVVEEYIEIEVFEPIELLPEKDELVFNVTSKPYRDEFWDAYAIDVYIENPTDKTAYVAMVETSVNDFMIDPYFTAEVAAGKKVNSKICFMKDDLDRNGINESIDKVAFKVIVYDAEWNEVLCSKELVVEYK